MLEIQKDRQLLRVRGVCSLPSLIRSADDAATIFNAGAVDARHGRTRSPGRRRGPGPVMRTPEEFLRALGAPVATAPRRRPAAGDGGAIRPWDYVRLRRACAGLTIAAAARRLARWPEERALAERTLRAAERCDVLLRDVRALGLSRAFAFDPAVYQQLVDGEPVRLCRGCGWDAWAEQLDHAGDACAWSAENGDLCTRCAPGAARATGGGAA
ncbi:hypothetical protein [Sphingomonas morindae]|uniref:Uncharacterized protein n=1 Tax=Sphingomonas morindae TaxID=1541170 RepID=A0ABY4X710_9SPHN|nr:hypothetical protein [Sphingomonas morindae]USI72691.1 hypothetical protein LHA26_15650 [Sphingomonas morindae]